MMTPTIEIDEASPSEDEAAAQAALHSFQGNASSINSYRSCLIL
jgi:hypothetical protein